MLSKTKQTKQDPLSDGTETTHTKERKLDKK